MIFENMRQIDTHFNWFNDAFFYIYGYNEAWIKASKEKTTVVEGKAKRRLENPLTEA